jgi:hypothetical protein
LSHGENEVVEELIQGVIATLAFLHFNFLKFCRTQVFKCLPKALRIQIESRVS